MKAAVIDTSIIGPWFWYPTTPPLLREFQSGELAPHAPRLLFLEVLNVAGRQLRWVDQPLRALADRLAGSRIELMDPELSAVATWVARGLTSYDASYVALAEQLGLPLVTTDRAILEVATGVAIKPDRLT